jgi:hypothetical protein
MEKSMQSGRAIGMAVLVALGAGCSTSVGLMPGPATAPPSGSASPALNGAPSAKIETGDAKSSGAAATYALRVNAYDPDGETLTIEWSATEGTFSSASTVRTVWTPAPTTASAIITVKVSDSRGASATDTTTIVVRRQP